MKKQWSGELERCLWWCMNEECKIGDKVRIKDAMDISYIGKIGIIEEISSHKPFSVKLNIDGKEGSWACAWLFSQIELI